jgi:hypothetical protein
MKKSVIMIEILDDQPSPIPNIVLRQKRREGRRTLTEDVDTGVPNPERTGRILYVQDEFLERNKDKLYDGVVDEALRQRVTFIPEAIGLCLKPDEDPFAAYDGSLDESELMEGVTNG